MHPPVYVDVFLQPIRDSTIAQVAFVAFSVLMVLDILFGLAAAAKAGEVKSSKMREGLWHKVGELGIIAVCDMLDGMMLGGVPLVGHNAIITSAAIIYMALNEAVSVLENIAKLNPDLAGTSAFKWLANTAQKDAEGIVPSDSDAGKATQDGD